jgi:hypothetical protein
MQAQLKWDEHFALCTSHLALRWWREAGGGRLMLAKSVARKDEIKQNLVSFEIKRAKSLFDDLPPGASR